MSVLSLYLYFTPYLRHGSTKVDLWLGYVVPVVYRHSQLSSSKFEISKTEAGTTKKHPLILVTTMFRLPAAATASRILGHIVVAESSCSSLLFTPTASRSLGSKSPRWKGRKKQRRRSPVPNVLVPPDRYSIPRGASLREQTLQRARQDARQKIKELVKKGRVRHQGGRGATANARHHHDDDDATVPAPSLAPLPDKQREKLNVPLPDDILPKLPQLTAYVRDIWLKQFRKDGASLRKLERDLAYRVQPRKDRIPMEKKSKRRQEIILPLLGHWEKEGLLNVFRKRSNKTWVITTAAATVAAAEPGTTKEGESTRSSGAVKMSAIAETATAPSAASPPSPALSCLSLTS